MHVSVGELVRLAPDALRGIGLSQPIADRATASVTWGEMVHGLAVRFLAERGAEIEAAARDGFRLAEHRAGALAIDELDAAGKCLLESGPRALDLAQAHAAAGEAGLILVRNTSGAFLAGELVCRSLARGRPLMVVFCTGEGQDPFEGDGLLIGRPAGQGGRIHAAALPAVAGAAARRLLLLLGLSDAVARDAAEALLGFTAAKDQLPRLAVLGWHAPAEISEQRLEAHLAAAPAPAHPPWCSVTNFDARQTAALRDGLDIDGEAWRAFGAYIQRTRVQTSERSRTQAG